VINNITRLYAASPRNPQQAAGLGSQGGFAATHGRGFRRGYVCTTINTEIINYDNCID